MSEPKKCGCVGACGHDRKPDAVSAGTPERWFRGPDGNLVKTGEAEAVPTMLRHYRQLAPNVFVRHRSAA